MSTSRNPKQHGFKKTTVPRDSKLIGSRLAAWPTGCCIAPGFTSSKEPVAGSFIGGYMTQDCISRRLCWRGGTETVGTATWTPKATQKMQKKTTQKSQFCQKKTQKNHKFCQNRKTQKKSFCFPPAQGRVRRKAIQPGSGANHHAGSPSISGHFS